MPLGSPLVRATGWGGYAMLRLIALTVGLACGIGTAFGADMPTKARPAFTNPFISYQNSAFYWFGGGFGGASTVDLAAGLNQVRLNATGGGVSAGGGYMWGHGTTWTAIDVRVNYDTFSGAGICTGAVCAFRQNLAIEGRLKYGGDSSRLAGLLPSFDLSGLFNVLPPIRDGILTPAHPYIFGYGEASQNHADMGAIGIKRWRSEFGGGVGIVHQLSSNKALDTWARCGFDPGSIGTTFKLGTGCKGGVDLIF